MNTRMVVGALTPIFPIPVGYELKPVGFDPAKGQMTEARTFQIQEIARAFQIPPVFLQDLTGATFSNVEQQDLHLVKHLIGQWAAALEGEMNLKLFGRMNGGKYVEHNLDGLLRGDFLTRMNGLARSVPGNRSRIFATFSSVRFGLCILSLSIFFVPSLTRGRHRCVILGSGITFAWSVAPDVSSVRANADQLELAFINLAKNARDAMDGTGAFSIEVSRLGDMAQVLVDDDGPGIPGQHTGQVFDAFFTTKPSGSGTGLGLAQVAGTVRQAGGQIMIEKSPAGGARFRILLPLIAD